MALTIFCHIGEVDAACRLYLARIETSAVESKAGAHPQPRSFDAETSYLSIPVTDRSNMSAECAGKALENSTETDSDCGEKILAK